MARIEVRRTDGERDSADLAELFGRGGASNGCWCQYWLLGADYHRRDRELNREALAGQVRAGEAGLLARSAGQPVGWARLTRRSALPYLMFRFDLPPGDPMAMPCFYVPARHRGQGVMRALIGAAIAAEPDLEAYPVDPAVPRATRNRFTGVLPVFLASGFTEVARLGSDRAVVRYHREARPDSSAAVPSPAAGSATP